MQAFSHSTTADAGTGWQQFSCPSAKLDAEENMSLSYGYEVTSKYVSSCRKNSDGEYEVNWSITG